MAGSSAIIRDGSSFFFLGAQFAPGTYRRVSPACRAERISEIIIAPEVEPRTRVEWLDIKVAIIVQAREGRFRHNSCICALELPSSWHR